MARKFHKDACLCLSIPTTTAISGYPQLVSELPEKERPMGCAHNGGEGLSDMAVAVDFSILLQ